MKSRNDKYIYIYKGMVLYGFNGIIKYGILYSGKISSRKLKLMHRNEM